MFTQLTVLFSDFTDLVVRNHENKYKGDCNRKRKLRRAVDPDARILGSVTGRKAKRFSPMPNAKVYHTSSDKMLRSQKELKEVAMSREERCEATSSEKTSFLVVPSKNRYDTDSDSDSDESSCQGQELFKKLPVVNNQASLQCDD